MYLDTKLMKAMWQKGQGSRGLNIQNIWSSFAAVSLCTRRHAAGCHVELPVCEIRPIFVGDSCESNSVCCGFIMSGDDKMFSLPFVRFLLWGQPLTPGVQPKFVYQNRVKGGHRVLEHVGFVTTWERERVRERERENGKYCANVV